MNTTTPTMGSDMDSACKYYPICSKREFLNNWTCCCEFADSHPEPEIAISDDILVVNTETSSWAIHPDDYQILLQEDEEAYAEFVKKTWNEKPD